MTIGRSRVLLRVLLLLTLLASTARAVGSSQIVHRYPVVGASAVSPVTTIGIRCSTPLDPRMKSSVFMVVGSRSGKHAGALKLSSDLRTAVFQPVSAFDLSEEVSVSVSLQTAHGDEIRTSYSFRVASNVPHASVPLGG